MKKIAITFLFMGFVTFCTVGSARAVAINYNFESHEFQSLYSQGYYDSVEWTLSGTKLTVTAHEVINDNNGNVINAGGSVNSGVWVDFGTNGNGLGAEGYGSDSDQLLDGSSSTNVLGEYIHDDGLLFSFDTAVTLTFLNLGSFNDNDDFNLTVDGITLLEDFDSNQISPYVNTIFGSDEYHFTSITGRDFLIWADGSSDEFLIDEITVTVTDTVPEPSTIGLLGIGLVGIMGVYLRRRKRKRRKLVA